MKNGICAAVCVLLLATMAYAQKVTVDSDPSAKFAAYKSYAYPVLRSPRHKKTPNLLPSLAPPPGIPRF